MTRAYYPLMPGGSYDGPEPDNYTGDPFDCDPPEDVRKETHWQTLDGRQIPYVQLEERHLLNILRTCRAGVVKVSETTLNALGREVLRRGTEPLPDYESYEEGMAVSGVSSLYMWWRRVPKPRLPHIIAVFDLYLNGQEVAQFAVDDDDGRTDAEKHCLRALLAYDKFLGQCSPAAKMRTTDVFKRWACAMHVDELLSL